MLPCSRDREELGHANERREIKRKREREEKKKREGQKKRQRDGERKKLKQIRRNNNGKGQ